MIRAKTLSAPRDASRMRPEDRRVVALLGFLHGSVHANILSIPVFLLAWRSEFAGARGAYADALRQGPFMFGAWAKLGLAMLGASGAKLRSLSSRLRALPS